MRTERVPRKASSLCLLGSFELLRRRASPLGSAEDLDRMAYRNRFLYCETAGDGLQLDAGYFTHTLSPWDGRLTYGDIVFDVPKGLATGGALFASARDRATSLLKIGDLVQKRRVRRPAAR